MSKENMPKETLENPSRRSLFKRKTANEIRLPWVISESIFVDNCTQCEACISQCETHIISKDAKGFPRIDFKQDECTFCNKCIDACNEPLFIEKPQREKSPPWDGEINISTQCLAENNIYCQSCRDVCDTNAITFSYINSSTNTPKSIPTPTLSLSDCTQCGACISTCPQGAISLNLTSNIARHNLAVSNTLTPRDQNV